MVLDRVKEKLNEVAGMGVELIRQELKLYARGVIDFREGDWREMDALQRIANVVLIYANYFEADGEFDACVGGCEVDPESPGAEEEDARCLVRCFAEYLMRLVGGDGDG